MKKNKTSNVFGVNISPIAIDRLSELGIKGYCCKLPAKPATSGKYDFVIAKSLLEHLKCTEESLRVMADLLKPGGKLIVSVPNNMLGPEVEPEHHRKYDEKSLVEELGHIFKIEKINVIDKSI